MAKWKCNICGKVIVVRDKKDKSRVGGHIGQHVRKKRDEKIYQKAVKLWKKGLPTVEISAKTGISLHWLRVILKKRLGKDYLKYRWKRRVKKKCNL